MRKFFVLLKKEVRELLTPQILVPMLIMVLVFLFIGSIIGSESKKTAGSQKIVILDQDNTKTSQTVIDKLGAANFVIDVYKSTDFNSRLRDVIKKSKEEKISNILVIPPGFTEGLRRFKPQPIETYSILRGFSVSGSLNSGTVRDAVAVMEDFISTELIRLKVPGIPPSIIKNPVFTNSHVIIGDRHATVDPGIVMGFVTSQTTFIPIILFIVIIFAAQMIVTAIATEKENKTLEALLAAPISRTSLVAAKMVAAGLMALVIALVYLFGFRYYMNGITAGVLGEMANYEMVGAIKELGLAFELSGYLLLGLSIFFGILTALAIAFTLGSLAEDLKSAQGLIAPLIFFVMIPYFLVLFLDLNSVSPVIKTLIYAIPFSHPFMAVPNLLLHNYQLVIYGIIYEALFFLVFLYIAAGMFSSDRILTMKLRLKGVKSRS